ncbi:MAG TPA: hypothetical protein VN706_22380 [Gemmatimonadaceae bacterium]|nr:hypothetical protein [Gemmatimonadaceae bacterium]
MRAVHVVPLVLVAALAACGSPSPTPDVAHPVVTGNAAELSRIVTGPQAHFWPRPSPDGSMLLLHVRDDSKLGDDRFSIVKVDINKPGRTLVSERAAGEASWYPDNSNFVYVTTRTGTSRLVRSSIAGNASGMTFLTPSTAGEYETTPDVSADGKKIAFVTTLDRPKPGQKDFVGTHTLATINTDGSSFTIFAEGEYPRWSPDGKRLAYERLVGQHRQIFTIDLSFGGQVTQLTSGEEFNNEFPAWSSDGKYLAYVSTRDGARNIWAMHSDGTQQTQLTRGKNDDDHPSWSSDGYLYFSSKAAGNYEIWRIRPLLGGPVASGSGF